MSESEIARYVQQSRLSATAQGVTVDRFTIPLPEYHHFLLVWLAEKFGRTQSQVASDLLRLAIDDAINEFRPRRDSYVPLEHNEPNTFGEHGEPLYGTEAFDYDVRDFEDRLRSGYYKWREEGKKPPRTGESVSDDAQTPPSLQKRAQRAATTGEEDGHAAAPRN